MDGRRLDVATNHSLDHVSDPALNYPGEPVDHPAVLWPGSAVSGKDGVSGKNGHHTEIIQIVHLGLRQKTKFGLKQNTK